MSGPAPKPTALKVIGGNAGKRPLNKQEPDPPALVDLTAPAWLPDGAKAVWDEMAPDQSQAKMLSAIDREEFAKYVFCCWQIREVADEVVAKPTCRSATTGAEYLNPKASYLSMMMKSAKGLAEQFGRTPAARSRVAIQPQGDLFDSLGSYMQGAPKRA
jgi:P27 family predicted phage terminase small subunit